MPIDFELNDKFYVPGGPRGDASNWAFLKSLFFDQNQESSKVGFISGTVLQGKMRWFRAAQGRAEEASERALKTVVPSTLRFSLIYPHQSASDVFLFRGVKSPNAFICNTESLSEGRF